MTSMTITVKPQMKKLVFSKNAIACGEHVAITIAGGVAEWATAEGASLRLRVIFGKKLIAKFPLTDADKWDVANGNKLACILNLNTVQAQLSLPFGGVCQIVLDDARKHRLYGIGGCRVQRWPREKGEDVPYSIDSYPDDVANLREELERYRRESAAATQSVQEALEEYARLADGIYVKKSELGRVLEATAPTADLATISTMKLARRLGRLEDSVESMKTL